MAVRATSGSIPIGITSTYEVDIYASDSVSVPNSTVFYALDLKKHYFKDANGSIADVFSSGGGLVGIPSQSTGIFAYFSTLEAASTAAVSGDTIYVYPGTYTVTTTATNGIAKSGVNFIFAPGCIVNKSSAGDMFNDNGFSLPCNVFGYGSTFAKTGSVGVIYKQYLPNAIFEATTATNTISHCFVTYRGEVHFKVDYATSTAGVVLGMAQSNSYNPNRVRVDMITWRSTASNVIGGFSWWYYCDLIVNGSILESTAANAVESIEGGNCIFNVTKILGTSYGITANDFGTNLAVNCVYCTGFSGSGTIRFNGHCQKILFSNYVNSSFAGGSATIISMNGGVVTTRLEAFNGGGENTDVTISGGTLNLQIGISHYGFGINSTGGTLNLYGAIQQTQQSYTKERIVNGGTVNVYANFIHGGNPDALKYYFFKLQVGTLRLKSCNMRNAFDNVGAHGIVWTGGTLIVDGVSIYLTNTEASAIQALTAGLNLKVLSGGLSTNRITGLLSAKKQKVKQTVTSVVSTSIQLNDGVGGWEVFTVSDTVTYNTVAKIAQQMAVLINASGTLNVTATQDTPGTDTYFYVESDVAGTPFTQQTLINLTTLTIRENSYAMTNVGGGMINENPNVE